MLCSTGRVKSISNSRLEHIPCLCFIPVLNIPGFHEADAQAVMVSQELLRLLCQVGGMSISVVPEQS